MSYEDRNIVPGLLAVMMTFKSIEWTFVTGPYQMRTLKIVQGVPVWKNGSGEKPSLNDEKTNWQDLILWTILLFTSCVMISHVSRTRFEMVMGTGGQREYAILLASSS
ncbi:hypothetical protein PSTG_19013 [Puccinia striiformis f. sp. tritici PST-78]|uniref:Uncharacterized protein n=1 Tax=Puccinia striiformis f. sp. tritici PST-78 TaxID=1165861 RepID=A0A0L0UKT6_9BASI|nr:hypothetical protein PSTG_19013 [Puccinia striiformis f. sp. tritici PST-78]